MIKALTKIGNSQGLILDKPILDLVGIPPNGQVEIEANGKALIIRAAKQQPVREIAKKITRTHERALRRLKDS
ncbi:MAG: AbrB/MazE/SpoVT family DNA-binding domain-containing protein [Myxococcales bacterium]